MKTRLGPGIHGLGLGLALVLLAGADWLATRSWAAEAASGPLSPAALVASPEGQRLFVACATAARVLEFDIKGQRVVRAFTGLESPSGLALAPDGTALVVTLAAPQSEIVILDLTTGEARARIRGGHTAMSPVISPDGAIAIVCHRFDRELGVYDLKAGALMRRIQVGREPMAAAFVSGGRQVLVAHHLHDGRADAEHVAATVSVVDWEAGRVIKELRLPNGSGSVQDLRVSPDGRYAVITHVVARFQLPTTQLERGWMNTNAETILDLETLSVLATVLLDSAESGAANPWGVAWTADGRRQIIAHAGTHEVSVIDFPGLIARIRQLPEKDASHSQSPRVAASNDRADVANDLSFLVGLRRRVALAASDRGPRAVAVSGSHAYVGAYFSDSLVDLDLSTAEPAVHSVALGPRPSMTVERQGEFYFHDATLCFQGWQSCATCHPGDARVDALNWDLLNDGLGNPKNNKSLLLAHRTPPAMSLGVRDTAETAVRAGIRHILFTAQSEVVAQAMDAYLKSLRPVASPMLQGGRLSASAQRGQAIFNDTQVGCAVCHPAGLFTDQQHHEVGTRNRFDREEAAFDTPTLIEVWRTAPYLHDGSAVDLHEMFRERNPGDQHGRTSHLRPEQLDDLIAYVHSL
ncbi:MAG: c-type cytochrome [Verrucomicrobiales bacterium]|nr:c-type cytochrome [Verrucomicrobiales bacterium]